MKAKFHIYKSLSPNKYSYLSVSHNDVMKLFIHNMITQFSKIDYSRVYLRLDTDGELFLKYYERKHGKDSYELSETSYKYNPIDIKATYNTGRLSSTVNSGSIIKAYDGRKYYVVDMNNTKIRIVKLSDMRKNGRSSDKNTKYYIPKSNIYRYVRSIQ